MQKQNLTLLDLNWNDILVPVLLPMLTLDECFKLRRVSKEYLQLIEFYFQNMKRLNINRKHFPVESFKVVSSCCKLRVLNLARSSFLNDQLLIPLLDINTHITSVNLSHCVNLTSSSLQPIILNCTNLRVLKLERCSWLTTGALETLTLHQSLLEEVDLSYCNLLSVSSIVLFLKKFRNLKKVSLAGIPQVGDSCIFTISEFCKLIQCLNLMSCTSVTDKGISTLVNCKYLDGLAIRNCPNVTERSLSRIHHRIMIDRPKSYITAP